MAFIYNADVFCDKCGEEIRDRLLTEAAQVCGDLADARGFDHQDESTYDSSEFPKYADGECETDSPSHCGAHADCLAPTLLSDGSPVGQLLGTNLTPDGVEYVCEAIADGGLVAELWADEFACYDAIAAVSPRSDGCDQCEAMMIQGIFCHETGCPNSHLDATGAAYDEDGE